MNFTINQKLSASYRLTKYITIDKDKVTGKITKQGANDIIARTLNIELDFENVTGEEVGNNFLSSQTTPVKMLYNNELQNWTDMEIVTNCKKGVYKCSVRKLLDDRKSRTLSDDEKRKRFLQSQLKAGKSKEDIKKDLEALLAGM